MAWLAEQVVQRKQLGQPLILLLDGQPSLWDAAADCLDTEEAVEILDSIHVSTYVWEAAALLTTTEEDRISFTRERLTKILQGKISSVIQGLRRMGSIANLGGEKLKTLQRVCGYLESNKSRMGISLPAIQSPAV